MNKIYLLLLASTLVVGNGYAQKKRTVTRKTANSSLVAKQKTEAETEAKAKADSIEAEGVKARELNNLKCCFDFSTATFISQQNSNDDFVVYEVPDMKSADLKSAVYTTLSSMYKSPKDVITSLSDNMIQLEGYASGVYRTNAGNTSYGKDILFDMVIQFKDGRVRYNRPTIKMIYTEWPLAGMGRLNMEHPLSKLIGENTSRALVESYFKNLICTINNKLKQSNDW